MRRTLIALCALFVSCAAAQDDGHQNSNPATFEGTQSSSEPAVEATPGTVSTETLHRVLGRSAGDFLRNVEVEAETQAGSFVGWRLVQLPETQPSWLDVRRGDVVTTINGLPVERPEDAQRVWETLRIASEVRIDLMRDGQRRSIRIPIVDVGSEDETSVQDPAARVGPEE